MSAEAWARVRPGPRVCQGGYWLSAAVEVRWRSWLTDRYTRLCRYTWASQPSGHTPGLGVIVYVCVEATALSRYHSHHHVVFVYGSILLRWYGTVWYGMVWYGMVWYGMV